MSSLYIRDTTPFEHNFILEKVDQCLKVAHNNGGAVFGGFVRDVMVPRMIEPSCRVSFKDVDLWFIRQDDADKFVTAMDKSLRLVPPPVGSSHEKLYPFARKQYMLYHEETSLCLIDVIVHGDRLPVNDFDVNKLFYQLHWSDKSLIDNIKNKHATMLEITK